MHNNSLVNEEKAEKDEVRRYQIYRFLLTINFGYFNKKNKFYFMFRSRKQLHVNFYLKFSPFRTHFFSEIRLPREFLL